MIRFNKFAVDLLRDDGADSDGPHASPKGLETIGQYLERQGYSDAFRDDYLIPLTAAMWRMSPNSCALQFPAITLVRSL